MKKVLFGLLALAIWSYGLARRFYLAGMEEEALIKATTEKYIPDYEPPPLPGM
jgi:hypothetical protein